MPDVLNEESSKGGWRMDVVYGVWDFDWGRVAKQN